MRGAGGIINERKKKIEITILQKLHGRCYMKTHATAVRIKKVWYIHTLQGEKSIFCFFLLKLQNVQKITLIPHWLFCIVVVFFLEKRIKEKSFFFNKKNYSFFFIFFFSFSSIILYHIQQCSSRVKCWLLQNIQFFNACFFVKIY